MSCLSDILFHVLYDLFSTTVLTVFIEFTFEYVLCSQVISGLIIVLLSYTVLETVFAATIHVSELVFSYTILSTSEVLSSTLIIEVEF